MGSKIKAERIVLRHFDVFGEFELRFCKGMSLDFVCNNKL